MTIDEDGNMVFPEASEQRQAEVGARFEAWLLQHEGRLTAEQERWLGAVGSQLRANADAWDEFTLGHFAFAPFNLMGGMPEAIRVFGGAAALEALLDSLTAAVFAELTPPPEAASAASRPQSLS